MAGESQHIEDALAGGFEMSVKLNVFEGPLDLLLFLIRKNEIDIYDIPIVEITKQYMAALRSMEKMSLDVAGEFFVMAATLMYIKSRMLLPTDERVAEAANEDDDSDVDPRWQLVEQLLEYKKIKQAANALEDLIDSRQNFGERRITSTDVAPERPLKPSDRMEIWTSFNLILRRLAEKLVQGEITGENVSVSDRMEFIIGFKEKKFTFTSLFAEGKTGLITLMATFIAMLELTRLHKLHLVQDEKFGEIFIEKIDAPATAQSEASDASDSEADDGDIGD